MLNESKAISRKSTPTMDKIQEFAIYIIISLVHYISNLVERKRKRIKKIKKSLQNENENSNLKGIQHIGKANFNSQTL